MMLLLMMMWWRPLNARTNEIEEIFCHFFVWKMRKNKYGKYGGRHAWQMSIRMKSKEWNIFIYVYVLYHYNTHMQIRFLFCAMNHDNCTVVVIAALHTSTNSNIQKLYTHVDIYEYMNLPSIYNFPHMFIHRTHVWWWWININIIMSS